MKELPHHDSSLSHQQNTASIQDEEDSKKFVEVMVEITKVAESQPPPPRKFQLRRGTISVIQSITLNGEYEQNCRGTKGVCRKVSNLAPSGVPSFMVP